MKYICYLNYKTDNSIARYNSPAAASKVLYISKCVSQFEKTMILSASGVTGKQSDKSRNDLIDTNLTIHYFSSLGRRNHLIGRLGTLWIQIQLFFYILNNVSYKEKLIVYHSLGYMPLIDIVHRIKRFKMILEVEEVYADVMNNNKIRNKEIRFFKHADGFIFPTKMLSDLINTTHKPEIIIHGNYQLAPEIKDEMLFANNNTENVIHCVYAGTLDLRKGGAVAAIKAAQFLSKEYHIHVLGFGSKDDVVYINKLINEVNNVSESVVTYDGLLEGDEYIRFLQSCDIGLSTQNPNAMFNNTSFPSKVLSYLSNGLQVVTARIPVLESSAVDDLISYYDDQSPEAIANTIKNIDIKNKNYITQSIKQLDFEFKRSIKDMIMSI